MRAKLCPLKNDFRHTVLEGVLAFQSEAHLRGFVPNQVHVNVAEIDQYPPMIKANGLTLKVCGRKKIVPPQHVRVCASKPEGEAV
jgi:hypothetical protein